LRKYVAALPALAFGFMANPAFSTTVIINAAGITAGTNTASFVGSTLTSTGGNFTKTTTTGTNPNTVIGVSTGFVSNEVDIDAEKITLSFGASGARVTEITIGLLFLSGVSGNAVNEAVQFETNPGSTCASGSVSYCILSASGAYKGSIVGVQPISPATAGNGGIFKITNPFGTEQLNSIQFLPWAIRGEGAANSDFGIVSITYETTAIPEPGTLSLVGLGLLGLAIAGGRRARD
jgi:hypothetical protein